MRFSLLFCSFLIALLPAFAADPVVVPPDSPGIRQARLDLTRVEGLVASGVLPRARLEDARNALADAQDSETIRTALYQKDVTVAEADELVALTEKRVERRRLAAEAREKLLTEGIIARSEATDATTALDQALRDHTWAVSRAQLARDIAAIAIDEQAAMRQMELANAARPVGLFQHFVGSNRFDMAQFPGIEKAFEARFLHPLPVSAMGETAVHRSLGFDHRNRVDIALRPDQPEGRWLLSYLTAHDIPFFAFASAVAHQATGAHIHIGPPSLHYVAKALPVLNRTGVGRATVGED